MRIANASSSRWSLPSLPGRVVGTPAFHHPQTQDPTYVYPSIYLPSSQYVRTVSMGYDQAVASYLS
jgi:hypothetical protein